VNHVSGRGASFVEAQHVWMLEAACGSVQPGSGYRTPGRERGAAARNRRAGTTEQAVDAEADALFARCLHVPCATKQCSGLFLFFGEFWSCLCSAM
jgi:hypothetical protein